MKKLLGIVVLGLFLASTSLASEVILRCKVDDGERDVMFKNTIRVAVEVNLKKKIIHVNDYLYKIETIGDRTIVAKRKNNTLKLDRYDGFFDLEDLKDPEQNQTEDRFWKGYCKKYNTKIF